MRHFIKNISLQNRIVIAAGAGLTAAFLIVVMICLPANKKVKRLKAELNRIKSQITQVESLVDQSKKIEDELRSLQDKFSVTASKFPEREEEAISILSSLANKSNIEIISTKSQPKTKFLDEDKNEIKVEGKVCQTFPVSVEIRSNYKDLLTYLETVKKYLPAMATFENLKIKKEAAGPEKLNIILDFYIYLLS